MVSVLPRRGSVESAASIHRHDPQNGSSPRCNNAPTSWTLSDGHAGNVRQVQALATAMGLAGGPRLDIAGARAVAMAVASPVAGRAARVWRRLQAIAGVPSAAGDRLWAAGRTGDADVARAWRAVGADPRPTRRSAPLGSGHRARTRWTARRQRHHAAGQPAPGRRPLARRSRGSSSRPSPNCRNHAPRC